MGASPPEGLLVTAPHRLAVLTSGGDAPGMNAAVRAVVRTALHRGLETYAVHEGYAGMIAGGDAIRPITSRDVGGILYQGGTVIGSARSPEFRERDGRRTAARNLVEKGIDALVVVGGDGSLTGADRFRAEWPELLAELVEERAIEPALAQRHAHLRLAGLVGSIDNDMFGTDMTIGADSALHRITQAVDAIRATAASHQRSFVIEVMGRNCGYLALMAALATGADWVLIPERPPDRGAWEDLMCERLRAGRANGRRQNLVILAEGAIDRDDRPITTDHVKQVLETRLGEDTRVTILGHVQRGGSPSAFDRVMSTQVGHAAVGRILAQGPEDPAEIVGIREHEIVASDLVTCVEQTHAVADRIRAGDFDGAMRLRGPNFIDSFETFSTLVRAEPHQQSPGGRHLRLAVLHAGSPAPGMNTAVRAAVRLGMDAGHTMLGVRSGFAGLRDGAVEELAWMSVEGWASRGGAELGTSSWIPDEAGCARIADQLRAHDIDGLLVVGGWAGYEAAYRLRGDGDRHAALALPIVLLPASIDNNLPGSELSVGADTALNAIVDNVDKIKQSAVAAYRCFVVEVMGHDSGYLALLSGIATGAERTYLPEEGITLQDLRADVEELRAGFERGKRLGLVIRSERADPVYTTPFVHAVLAREGGEAFDVRQAILGHVQSGGAPSPFDRILATRLAARCLERLVATAVEDGRDSVFIGLENGAVVFTDLAAFPDLTEPEAHRPRHQPWLRLRTVAAVVG